MDRFKVTQIDHVEVLVPDRYRAAGWYEKALGLEILKDFEHWADDPQGPLMISSDGGVTKLALFTGEPQCSDSARGIVLVAFRVDSIGFHDFLTHGPLAGVYDPTGERLASLKVKDHDKSWSVYFADPWGNALEVTTYEYDQVAAQLR